VRWLWLTIGLGVLFIGIKLTEYTIEWHDHLIPYWHWSDVSPDGKTRADQVELFMAFYFVMTMFHALHMVIGVGILGTVLVLAKRNHFTKEYHHPVEVVGLYWHFVDTVWVFLFPTLYLLRH
jgi:cytochrome c oxidase subunit III